MSIEKKIVEKSALLLLLSIGLEAFPASGSAGLDDLPEISVVALSNSADGEIGRRLHRTLAQRAHAKNRHPPLPQASAPRTTCGPTRPTSAIRVLRFVRSWQRQGPSIRPDCPCGRNKRSGRVRKAEAQRQSLSLGLGEGPPTGSSDADLAAS